MSDKRLKDAHAALHKMVLDGIPPPDGTLQRSIERVNRTNWVMRSPRYRELARAVARYRRGDFS